MITAITSPQNEQFKYYKTLLKSKGLNEGRHFILSGSKLINEFLCPQKKGKSRARFSPDPARLDLVEVLLVAENRQETCGALCLQQALPKNNQRRLRSDLFEELDVLGTQFPLLIVKQPEIKVWSHAIGQSETSKLDGLCLLCPLGDPQNLGALARSAYAFGAQALVLLKEAAHPFLPKALKASAGSLLEIPLYWGPSIHDLQAPVVALDTHGLNLNEWPQTNPLWLLVGEEGVGIPTTFQGTRLTLPMKNQVESLNATVAASIAIYNLTHRF